MSLSHQRKKQPEVVRRALLEGAARIVAEGGVGSATLQAVAEAAGVTKGGLLHHFPSKQALVEALFADLLAQLDAQIEESLDDVQRSYGRFTRAYVRAISRLSEETSNGVWAALTLAMQSEKPLRGLWSDWLERRLRRHAATDADAGLAVLRYAADGIWLAALTEETPAADGRHLLALIDRLSRKPIAP